jgi:hypothetical protein
MAFTVGIEEEYLLTDTTLGRLALDPPKTVFEHCRRLLGDQVTPEMLRAQPRSCPCPRPAPVRHADQVRILMVPRSYRVILLLCRAAQTS